ncbi:MAG TPA: response regulator [Bryobacteraceae bacterium]|nr:response regulator [Bryobacteraceae bacterium]
MAKELAKQALAQLRHQLRTPLNHIIGYSEILLEEAAESRIETRAALAEVHTSARLVLDLVQQILGASAGPITERELDLLRSRMQEPVQAIMRQVNALVAQRDSADILDLLRINSAASELLSFGLGQPPKEAVAPAPLGEGDGRDDQISADVLLVDDDETNRDILSRQLQRTGCAVTTAEDAQAALSRISKQRFDVVLLDILMPGVDGVTALKQIKSERPDLPVIMISALDEMESVRQCLQLGAEDYLLKPFDPVLLQSGLAATLDRSRLRQAERERTRALEAALNQLQEVNGDLQQFAYAASHDLQSPIRTVMTMSQLLTRRYKGRIDEEADHLIDSITEGMRRLNELVDDLLAYSRLSWRGEEPPVEFPLREAVDFAMANLEEQRRAAGASIEIESLPFVVGRRTHYIQLFQNLIGNSIKYRGDKAPRVRVTSSFDGEECTVHVSDNGIGFDSAYAARVFEPFQRLHGYDYPGSGIGLAICARVVKQYGGRIWAESEVGKGSVFSFTIPMSVCRPVHTETARV